MYLRPGIWNVKLAINCGLTSANSSPNFFLCLMGWEMNNYIYSEACLHGHLSIPEKVSLYTLYDRCLCLRFPNIVKIGHHWWGSACWSEGILWTELYLEHRFYLACPNSDGCLSEDSNQKLPCYLVDLYLSILSLVDLGTFMGTSQQSASGIKGIVMQNCFVNKKIE